MAVHLNPHGTLRKGAAVAGPLALILLPKCPLCLLPFVAALGIAIPPGPLLNGIFAAVVIVWASLFMFATTSTRMRLALIAVAAIAIAGKIANVMPVELTGIALMFAFGVSRVIRVLRGRARCAAHCM
jgi:hypothetical protein